MILKYLTVSGCIDCCQPWIQSAEGGLLPGWCWCPPPPATACYPPHKERAGGLVQGIGATLAEPHLSSAPHSLHSSTQLINLNILNFSSNSRNIQNSSFPFWNLKLRGQNQETSTLHNTQSSFLNAKCYNFKSLYLQISLWMLNDRNSPTTIAMWVQFSTPTDAHCFGCDKKIVFIIVFCS